MTGFEKLVLEMRKAQKGANDLSLPFGVRFASQFMLYYWETMVDRNLYFLEHGNQSLKRSWRPDHKKDSDYLKRKGERFVIVRPPSNLNPQK